MGEIKIDKILSAKIKDGYGNVIMDLMDGGEYVPLDAPLVEKVVNVEGCDKNRGYVRKELVEQMSDSEFALN